MLVHNKTSSVNILMDNTGSAVPLIFCKALGREPVGKRGVSSRFACIARFFISGRDDSAKDIPRLEVVGLRYFRVILDRNTSSLFCWYIRSKLISFSHACTGI
ncbi:hypothetical protein CDAR_34951 [Caerostris darwini]|uniref:Uncharacterized protein n=1 Tax=Caerostris darwini TaxID=1538125 RepID=A0AAV4MUX2_9ARAC|nr:hypothetical protein CDAR_34951 [Caerostris darwini]